MPNADNITAPVTLVGAGRSGTTLVTNVFRAHPDFRAVGETANIIFTTYRTLEMALPVCGRTRGRREPVPAARDAVHAMLLNLFGSNRPRWFHKPIFAPNILSQWQSPEKFGQWYWDAFNLLFPRGRVFTVLRDPADTVASMMVRWGDTPEKAFTRLDRAYQLMLHPASRLEWVIDFESLTADPEQAVRQLLEFAEAPFHEDCLSAFDRQHAQNPDVPRATDLVVPTQVTRMFDELRAWVSEHQRPTIGA